VRRPESGTVGNGLVPPLLTDLLRGGLAVRLEVTGHSMTPVVRRGDVVTITPHRGARLSLGDVVAFVPGRGRLTVHRIVGRAAGYLLPRGDAAPTADPPITRDDVLGVVTRVERRDRRVGIGLGPERRAVAWLSRIGLLGHLARVRASHERRTRVRGDDRAGVAASLGDTADTATLDD
jgi:hypothetical protein